jgi:hypothetical protein
MAGHELDLAVPEMANTPPKGRRTRRFPTAAFVGPTLPRADQPAYGVRIMGKWSWRWASCFAFVLAACAPQAPSATPPPLPPPAASQSPAAVAVAPAPGPESSVSALGIAAAAPRAARSSAPVPLVAAGHPVSWWFAFKFNAGKFAGCAVAKSCSFGDSPQNYTLGEGDEFAVASSDSPTLAMHTSCIGEDAEDDPVGRTFAQVYANNFFYVASRARCSATARAS